MRRTKLKNSIVKMKHNKLLTQGIFPLNENARVKIIIRFVSEYLEDPELSRLYSNTVRFKISACTRVVNS